MTCDERPAGGDAFDHVWISDERRQIGRWATRNAFDTLTSDDVVYATAVAHARQARDLEAFAAWAWPMYAAMLCKAGYDDPAAYAETDLIDWGRVRDRLRAD